MVENATVTFSISGRFITITCFPGYRFSGGIHQGYVTAKVFCKYDNTWNSVTPCTRMSTSLVPSLAF